MTDGTDPAALLAKGRVAEAEAASERRLAVAPDDVRALRIVALGALRRGDARRARELLERAARGSPDDSLAQHHLGRACEALGDTSAALAADAAAVRAAPASPLARLYYAAGLERQGDRERAVLQFMRAMKEAQQAGHWLDAATTPEPIRALVERAAATVRKSRRAALDRVLEPLVARYGASALHRVAAATRIYLGEQTATYADPRQRPTFFYVPGLPATAYLDPRVFAWAPDYEACHAGIRRELEALLPGTQGRERVFDSEALEEENLRGSDVAPSWNGYYFYRHGVRREENCSACPVTAAALDALPLIRIRDHGPEVLFSVFTPGTHLLPHRGVTNARVVCHLPLIVPADCALKVGGELHEWREGRVVIFDDTYEHEAWNRSQQLRVVLIADVWNPHLSHAERAAITEVITAIGDQRAAVEAA
jgi:aspartate beta-hydroxylase